MKTYTYSEARQRLASMLDEASRSGEVRIRRRDGRIFALKPVKKKKNISPFDDVKGLNLDISVDEIVSIVREGRERDYDVEK